MPAAAGPKTSRVKRAAFGFTSFRNYRIRSLLYAGSPTGRCSPRSHPAEIRSPVCCQFDLGFYGCLGHDSAIHTVRKGQGNGAGQPPLLPEKVRRRVVGERAKGLSLGAIATKLNDEGVYPASERGRWYASTVCHVLRSLALDDEPAKMR